jgi:signal transduction histidine kinase
LTLSRKNDEVYDAVVQVAPLPDAEGNARHYLVSHRDVTNLKALQRMQTQFVHNVSHELRTPVAILKLYAELLVSSPTGTGKRAAYEKAIYTTATHLSRLVHDILTLNTLDNRDIVKPEVEILQINTLICQDILQTCEALHDGDMPQIILKMEKPSPTIKANPWWLSQALLHILDNAMRYTPPDGAITLATARKTSQDGAWVTITVRDTGMGIAAEELPLIFNRFFRGHQVEELQVPGTGLGLAIAHEIVRMYSGHINVESTPHEGSTFTIWLPDASAAPSAS